MKIISDEHRRTLEDKYNANQRIFEIRGALAPIVTEQSKIKEQIEMLTSRYRALEQRKDKYLEEIKELQKAL